MHQDIYMKAKHTEKILLFRKKGREGTNRKGGRKRKKEFRVDSETEMEILGQQAVGGDCAVPRGRSVPSGPWRGKQAKVAGMQ